MENNYYINDDGNKIFYNKQKEYAYNLAVTSRNYEIDVFNGIKDFYEKKYNKTFMLFSSFSSLIIDNGLNSTVHYGLRLTENNIIIYGLNSTYTIVTIYILNIENKIVENKIIRDFSYSETVSWIYTTGLPVLYINDEETYMAIGADRYVDSYYTPASTTIIYDVYDMKNNFNHIYSRLTHYTKNYSKNKTNFIGLTSNKLIFQDDVTQNNFHIIELENNNKETIFTGPTYINKPIWSMDCSEDKVGFLVESTYAANTGSYLVFDISDLTNIVLYKEIMNVRDNILFKVFKRFYNGSNIDYMKYIPIYLDSDGIIIGSLFNFYSLHHYIVYNTSGYGNFITTHFFPATMKIDFNSKILFYEYTNIFNTYYTYNKQNYTYIDPYTNISNTIEQDFNNLYIWENDVKTSDIGYNRIIGYYYGSDIDMFELKNTSENKYIGCTIINLNSYGYVYIELNNNFPNDIRLGSDYTEQLTTNVNILQPDYDKPPIDVITKNLRLIPVNDVPVIKIDDTKVDTTNYIYLIEDTTETFNLYIYDEETVNIDDITIYVDDDLSSPVLYTVDKYEKTLDITTPLNYYGTFTMSIRCKDITGLYSPTVYYTVIVSNINDAPTVNDRDFVGYEDSVISGTFTSSDIEGDSVTYTIIEEPTNGIVQITSGNYFNYTPNVNFNGVDTFKYKGNDGKLDSLNVGTVTITVRSVNDAPLFDKEIPMSSYISTEGQEVTVTAPYYSDIDNDITELRLTAHGTGVGSYVDNLDGTITITCSRNVIGVFDIDLKVYDTSGLNDVVTFQLKVDRDWGSNCTIVKDSVNPRRLFLERSNSYDFSILNLTKDDINILIDDETNLDNLYKVKLNDIKYPHPHNYLLITDYVNKDGSILNYTKNKVIETKVIEDYLNGEDFSLIVQKFTQTRIEFTTDYIFDFTQGEEKFNTCTYDEIGVTKFIFEDIEYYQINYIKYTINNKEVIFNNKTVLDYNRDYTLYYKNNYGVYYYNKEKKKVFFNKYF